MFWFEAVEQFWGESPDFTFYLGPTERLGLVLITEFILEKTNLLTLLGICMFLPLEGMLRSAPAIKPLETFQGLTVGLLRER